MELVFPLPKLYFVILRRERKEFSGRMLFAVSSLPAISIFLRRRFRIMGFSLWVTCIFSVEGRGSQLYLKEYRYIKIPDESSPEVAFAPCSACRSQAKCVMLISPSGMAECAR